MKAFTGWIAGRSMRTKRVALLVAVLAVWEITGLFSDPIVWPPLHEVVASFVSLVADGSLEIALGESLLLLLIGLITAIVTGLVVGVVIGRNRLMERAVVPYLGALYATPTVALIPLLLVWFGFGLGGRVAVVWMVAFFSMVVNVHAGVRDTPKELTEVARSLGVRSEWGLLRTVVLPSAMPMIMTGIRLSIGRGIVGVAVAEVYLRLSGIGALIEEYGSSFQTAFVIASIAVLPALGVTLTALVGRVERRFTNWRP